MSGVNKVILVGHIGEAPDLRRLNDDVAVLSFPLATTETMKKNDQKTEITEWHNIVMLRGIAESAARLLTKGILVYLEGKLHTRSFTDAAGIKRYTTEVIAESFKPLGRKSDFEDRDQE